MIKTLKVSEYFAFVIFILISGCSAPPENQFTIMDPVACGIQFQNNIQETHNNNILRNEYTYNGGGVAVGDVNNDGFTDVYFSGNQVMNRLYINKGDWIFEDITAPSGTGGRKDWSTGVVMVDVNGDSWLDIYVCYSGNTPGEGYNLPVKRDQPGRANQLFINNGCKPGGIPTFTEKAKEFGLDAVGTFSTQAYFFDYDLDGDLDLFLQNHANTFYAPFINTKKLRNLRHPYFGNKLYRNDKLRFVEVSEEAGIHGSGLNFGLSTSISDINMDNWPDLYVTNDYDEQDYCYINNQDGTFREVSHEMIGHMSKSSMGSDMADINNDGYVDILVSDMLPEDNYRQKLLRGQDGYERYQLSVDSGFHHQYVRNILQLNRGLATNGLPKYSEIGQFAGISNTDWSWSALLVDLDNDGLRDMFITNGYLKDITNMDNMTRTTEIYKMARQRKMDVNYLSLIEDLPITRLKNYVYKNIDGIKFNNVSDDWGFMEETVSNGAAYADFDNDGDYDLITNNLNQTVSILRNNQNELEMSNYVKIKLTGGALNTCGIGAKIWLETEDKTIFQEVYNTRGYLSSSDLIITMGIGRATRIPSLKVLWPGGQQSSLQDVQPNQLIELNYDQSSSQIESQTAKPNPQLFEDVTAASGIDYRHIENEYDDYQKDRLLPYQLSRLGGKLAVGDVDNDGNDDVFFGGASGYPGKLFMGRNDGTFVPGASQPWEKDKLMEDIDALFFDTDNDGDVDLYVVSGGNSFNSGNKQYQDRLYLNEGSGQFIRKTKALPEASISGSCAISCDFDKDGDLDLFVGGRHLGSRYPFPPKSSILRNETEQGNVKFVDITSDVCPLLENVGMVTDAVWTDYNGDNWPDLIIVGEWMAITIFKNENGQLVQQEFASLGKSNGWWTSIEESDVDGDGDPDYLLGNAGLNFQFRASASEPVEIYAHDFNNDGTIDPILSYYNQGASYPLASRNELLEQLAPWRKKFTDYESYATATTEDVIGKNMVEKVFRLQAFVLESCWLENRDGDFKIHTLPDLVQFSPVNAFVQNDFNMDEEPDVLAVGNFYPYIPQIGMHDASFGSLLQFSQGSINVMHEAVIPFSFNGDIRDMALLSFNSGKKMLVVSRNNDVPGCFLLKTDIP